MGWVNVTDTSIQALADTGYLANNSAQVTITLPAAPAVSDVIKVKWPRGGRLEARAERQAVHPGR